ARSGCGVSDEFRTQVSQGRSRDLSRAVRTHRARHSWRVGFPAINGGLYGGVMHFADRLLDACRKKGNAVCAGIDPRWDLLPAELRKRHPQGTLDALAAACEEF